MVKVSELKEQLRDVPDDYEVFLDIEWTYMTANEVERRDEMKRVVIG